MSWLQWIWNTGYYAGDDSGLIGPMPQAPDLEILPNRNTFYGLGALALLLYFKPWK